MLTIRGIWLAKGMCIGWLDRPINSWTRFVSHVFWAIGTLTTILTLLTFPFLSDFDYVANPRYGRCLQFPKAKSLTSSTRFTGPRFGLQLVLNLDVDQYTFASNVGKGLVDQHTFASSVGKTERFAGPRLDFKSFLIWMLIKTHSRALRVRHKGMHQLTMNQCVIESKIGRMAIHPTLNFSSNPLPVIWCL